MAFGLARFWTIAAELHRVVGTAARSSKRGQELKEARVRRRGWDNMQDKRDDKAGRKTWGALRPPKRAGEPADGRQLSNHRA